MTTSAELMARAVKVIPGGVNSPVRAFQSVGLNPHFIDRADGPYVWDVECNRYIDYIGSWGPMILGHNDQAVREAVEGPLSARWPASVLQLHPHATIVVDEDAASQLAFVDYYRTTFAGKPAGQGL